MVHRRGYNENPGMTLPILKAGRVILIDGDGNLMKEVDETKNIAVVLLPYAEKVIRQFNSIIGGYEIMIADEKRSFFKAGRGN